MNIIEAINEKDIFGSSFEDLRTWQAWQAFLKALFGLEMAPEEARIYQEHTKNRYISGKAQPISYILSGRRSGKSKISAVLACYLATYRNWSKLLTPGELGYIVIIANGRDQARVVKNYISGILKKSPRLRSFVKKDLTWEIQLNNRVTIAVRTKNFRTLRGYTIIAAILEELAFWRSEESANPDIECLAAVQPAMLTIKDSMLIGISSAYAKRGLLYDQYKKFYGKNKGPLIWKSSTIEMNPLADKEEMARQIKEDPAKYKSEYLSEFRGDIESYLGVDDLDRITAKKIYSRPYDSQYKYYGFCDPSGGRVDSMTLGITHIEKDKIILDQVLEIKAPFSPDNATKQFSEVLKTFQISTVNSDRYAGAWVEESFKNYGILVEYSKLSASQIYANFIPIVMNNQAVLLDNKILKNQLSNLERRTGQEGREIIDHPAGSHDDLANCAAGACYMAAESKVDFALKSSEGITEPISDSLEERLNIESKFWLMGIKKPAEILDPEKLEKEIFQDLEKELHEKKTAAVIKNDWKK